MRTRLGGKVTVVHSCFRGLWIAVPWLITHSRDIGGAGCAHVPNLPRSPPWTDAFIAPLCRNTGRGTELKRGIRIVVANSTCIPPRNVRILEIQLKLELFYLQYLTIEAERTAAECKLYLHLLDFFFFGCELFHKTWDLFMLNVTTCPNPDGM